MTNPQEVQFGKTPPGVDAEVAYGGVAASPEVTVSEIGKPHDDADDASDAVPETSDAAEPETPSETPEVATEGD